MNMKDKFIMTLLALLPLISCKIVDTTKEYYKGPNPRICEVIATFNAKEFKAGTYSLKTSDKLDLNEFSSQNSNYSSLIDGLIIGDKLTITYTDDKFENIDKIEVEQVKIALCSTLITPGTSDNGTRFYLESNELNFKASIDYTTLKEMNCHYIIESKTKCRPLNMNTLYLTYTGDKESFSIDNIKGFYSYNPKESQI